jgi:hypothetical protein
MEKIEYRYRFWYWPKFMVSDWYRIETKKAGIGRIAHHYACSYKCTWKQPLSRPEEKLMFVLNIDVLFTYNCFSKQVSYNDLYTTNSNIILTGRQFIVVDIKNLTTTKFFIMHKEIICNCLQHVAFQTFSPFQSAQ